MGKFLKIMVVFNEYSGGMYRVLETRTGRQNRKKLEVGNTKKKKDLEMWWKGDLGQ